MITEIFFLTGSSSTMKRHWRRSCFVVILLAILQNRNTERTRVRRNQSFIVLLQFSTKKIYYKELFIECNPN
jgi:hypothetical protein